MSYEERVSYINERAQKDYLSKDVEYNKEKFNAWLSLKPK